MRNLTLLIVVLTSVSTNTVVEARIHGGGFLPWFFPRRHRKACNANSQPMSAVQCIDNTTVFVCEEAIFRRASYRNSICQTNFEPESPMSFHQGCIGHGGLGKVLPQFTGCFPEATNFSFWESYFPDTNFSSVSNVCDAELSIPELNPPNADFEDESLLGLSGWGKVVTGPDSSVGLRTDNFPRCESTGMCLAHQGTGYAKISAGAAVDQVTPPNTLFRSSFRIPEVDQNFCDEPVKFCLSFAMRFVSKETVWLPSETGRNDYFTVEIQQDDSAGAMLFNKTIHAADIEGVGDNTGWNGLGDDSGWELVQVPLPTIPLGVRSFFTFRAMTINVNDTLLDSTGYIDTINVGMCG
eukprot:Nitzschia sp. Nitz4//NODE_657_length_7541_cov_75.275047//1809//2934//NITZ4_additional_000095-RA//-1//CDS//3329532019//5251//frame0